MLPDGLMVAEPLLPPKQLTGADEPVAVSGLASVMVTAVAVIHEGVLESVTVTVYVPAGAVMEAVVCPVFH